MALPESASYDLWGYFRDVTLNFKSFQDGYRRRKLPRDTRGNQKERLDSKTFRLSCWVRNVYKRDEIIYPFDIICLHSFSANVYGALTPMDFPSAC
jgi:hypothetical protein